MRFLLFAIACLCSFSMSSEEMIEHVVQRGETFALIADRYGITEQMLRNANSHIDACYTGLTLQINPNDIETMRKYREQIEAERAAREMYSMYEQAWALMDDGEYKSAQKVFDKIIARSPATALAYYNRGVCKFNREKWKDAASDFGLAIGCQDCDDELKEKSGELKEIAWQNQEIYEQNRANAWLEVLNAGVAATSTAMNVYAAQKYSTPVPQTYSMSASNMDYLLNPYYAAAQASAQQQYLNNVNAQLISTSIQQVEAQYQFGYEQMKQHNPSLTYDQFLQMRAQNYGYSENSTGNYDLNTSSTSFDYQSTYRRWEKRAEDIYKTLTIGGSRSSSDSGIKGTVGGDMFTTGGSYTSLKMDFNNAQKEMRRVRNEASAAGINISPSQWETATISY